MLYQWLLWLYPAEFRRQYRDELEADFIASRQEARANGRLELWRCYLQVALDLAVSVPREWLRTPWPVTVRATPAPAPPRARRRTARRRRS